MSTAGMPESDWIHCAALNRSPVFSSDSVLEKAGRLIVVAPHPDDETLSAGGLMAAAAERGCPIIVVVVTDGEASHDGSKHWTREALAIRRIAELSCALTRLDAANATVLRLRLADGRVNESIDTLTNRLRTELRASDLVVCPWRHDGHPDHEAAAAAVLAATLSADCRVLEAPIWMWHWRTPDFPLIEWPRLVRVRFSSEIASRKKSALAAFVSQRYLDPTLDRPPILDESAMAHFERDFESFFDHVA